LRDYLAVFVASGGLDDGFGNVTGYTQFFATVDELADFLKNTPLFTQNPAIPSNWWVILNKTNLLAILNDMNQGQRSPSDVKGSIFVSLPPRDSGVNARIERKKDYTGNVGEAQPVAGSLSANVIRLTAPPDMRSYLASVYKQLEEAGSQIAASLVLRILVDFNAGSITETQCLDRLRLIDLTH
jgi:hypothetical protein